MKTLAQYLVVIDVAKKQDATSIQIWRNTPEFLKGDERVYLQDRIFHYFDLVFQTKMEKIPYTDQADKIKALMDSEAMKNNSELIVDGTGVGEAIIDILRSKSLRPTPIVFTGGDQLNIKYEKNLRRFGGFGAGIGTMQVIRQLDVPKKDLVAAGQTMIQQCRLRIAPEVQYANDFRKQLVHFKGKVNEKTGYTSYNNDNPEVHDDFTVCFLMAMWYFRYRHYMDDERIVPPESRSNSYDWDPLGKPGDF